MSADAENLRAIGRYFRENSVEIRGTDFENACTDARPGDFIYLDPPYVPVSKTADFTAYVKDGFSYEDHQRVANLAKRLSDAGAYIMVSNNDVETVRELYSGFKIESMDVRRAINRKADSRTGKEVIIRNY